jgi:hypothetical protein
MIASLTSVSDRAMRLEAKKRFEDIIEDAKNDGLPEPGSPGCWTVLNEQHLKIEVWEERRRERDCVLLLVAVRCSPCYAW